VVSIDPSLGSRSAIPRYQKDYVLGPQTPPLEITGKCEDKSKTTIVDHIVHVSYGCDQHNSFRRIGAGSLEDSVDILVRDVAAGSLVRVLLGSDLEIVRAEDVCYSL
jgi:hypothetical protein